jgi:hypothetical protein
MALVGRRRTSIGDLDERSSGGIGRGDRIAGEFVSGARDRDAALRSVGYYSTTLGVVTRLLLITGVVACCASARRASRVDPLVALR